MHTPEADTVIMYTLGAEAVSPLAVTIAIENIAPSSQMTMPINEW